MTREVLHTPNFVADAAKFIHARASEALSARGQFRIALSGGNTPRPVYSELAKMNLPWDQIFFTFGDERCVPPDDAESNFRMARESLFDLARIPEKSIARMRGEIDPPIAAQEYAGELERIASDGGEPVYRHDLILLGVGDDGHTASLFPGTAAVSERTRTVVANFVPRFNSWRITFTFPMINQARHICFLANANKNAGLLDKVLGGDRQFPAAQVEPADGAITWILAEA